MTKISNHPMASPAIAPQIKAAKAIPAPSKPAGKKELTVRKPQMTQGGPSPCRFVENRQKSEEQAGKGYT